MILSIENETDLLLEGKIIFIAEDEIVDAKIFDDNKIIVHINNTKKPNLFCIDKTGKTLWIAESIAPKVYVPYQAFDIKEGYIYAVANLASMDYDAKIDPNTGKVLEKEFFR